MVVLKSDVAGHSSSVPPQLRITETSIRHVIDQSSTYIQQRAYLAGQEINMFRRKKSFTT